jgi:hypothetical protein
MTPAAILLVALVADDPAFLRSAPRDDAAPQATLWRGDWLEVRGEGAGFLRVYDHRRERPGYVRPAQVRVYRLDAAAAPELAAIVRFLRDADGAESLGIGYAALALRAAPAGADPSEILAAIGTMADRLARRASGLSPRAGERRGAGASRDAALAAHLEVARSYGVKLEPADGAATPGGQAPLCYDGQAWEQVLATASAPPLERARAALSLSSERCRDPRQPPAAARAFNDHRLAVLDAVDLGRGAPLPAEIAGRLRLRRAQALAFRAFDEARRDDDAAAARTEAAAIRELALADRGALAPEDLALYEDVAVRVAATRFATETPSRDEGRRAVTVAIVPRAPGETCVRVLDRAPKPRLLGERCTYGLVWRGALRWAAAGTVATLTVQPLPAWAELWVLRRTGDGTWSIDPLAPAASEPDVDVGYVEAAGTSPDGARLLVVRETRGTGRPVRRFQVLSTSTLAVQSWASSPDRLSAFKRWSTPAWRAGTLALRSAF